MFNRSLWLIVISIAFYSVISFSEEKRPRIYVLKKEWICFTKLSCVECLKLTYCSWCDNFTDDGRPNCYSPELEESYCTNNTIPYKNYDLSFEGNAKCACSGGEMEHKNCRPRHADPDTPDCSGRGECLCGRCVCNRLPDPEHPTKVIVGEYCEYDNFSCDGPDCNEGPYPLIPESPADPETESDGN